MVGLFDCILGLVYTRYASLCILAIWESIAMVVMSVDGRIHCPRDGGWSLQTNILWTKRTVSNTLTPLDRIIPKPPPTTSYRFHSPVYRTHITLRRNVGLQVVYSATYPRRTSRKSKRIPRITIHCSRHSSYPVPCPEIDE